MLDRIDDHYNQDRYRYERDIAIVQSKKPWQRWNYAFLFAREACNGFFFNTQLGHRDNWYKEIKICLK